MLVPPQPFQKTDIWDIKTLRKLSAIEFGIATKMALAPLLGVMVKILVRRSSV
jgi:hypothetical protein